MDKLVKAAVLLAIILVLGGLANSPGHATVPGDIQAGLPLKQVIANGLAAGMSIDDIQKQALEAGADPNALSNLILPIEAELTAAEAELTAELSKIKVVTPSF